MKKKIFGGVAILAIAVVAVFNVNFGEKDNGNSSILSLANVVALANGDVDEKKTKKCRQSSQHYSDGMNGIRCSKNDYYNTYSVTGTKYSCGEGSDIGGNGCKEGVVLKGNDCNNSHQGDESGLKKVC